MATITKKLKFAEFAWDDNAKVLSAWTWGNLKGEEYGVALNKTYAFALMRFIIRIAQRNWLRRKK